MKRGRYKGMPSFRFIHCADLHLGCRFVGVSAEDEDLGKAMREATFKALDLIVDAVSEKDVDFVVFAGDVFDEETQSPRVRHLFAQALRRAGVPCYIAYGNHDYRREWEDCIPLPDNAFVFPPEGASVMYPDADAPVTEITGISYDRRNVTEDLTQRISGSPSLFTIAVLHCEVDAPEGSGMYSPCRSEAMTGRGVDYWALGHVHTRSVIRRDPYIVYPGNTQGRNPRETGEKGAYLVTVEDGGVSGMEFLPTHSILWESVSIDITGKDLDGLVEEISATVGVGSLVRLTLTGRGDLDRMLRLNTEGAAEAIAKASGCRLVGLELQTSESVDLEARRGSGDFVDAALTEADRLTGEGREAILDEICRTKASQNVRRVFEAMEDGELEAMVRDASRLLAERLMEAGR